MSAYKPVRYQAASPETEVIGSLLVMFTENLRAEDIQPVLRKHNLEKVDPTRWYSQQLVLDILHDIEGQFSFEELVAIGMKGSEVAPIPPQVNSIEAVLQAFNGIYQGSTRNMAEGEGLFAERLGDRHYRLVGNTPVPAFVMYGAAYGLVKRFRQPGDHPKVYLVDEGTPFVIEVKW